MMIADIILLYEHCNNWNTYIIADVYVVMLIIDYYRCRYYRIAIIMSY